jgi:chromosome segregation ATPase
MSRIKLVIELVSVAVTSLIFAWLALGPETVTRKLDDALSASWRALGDRLATRELDGIARELDRERQDFELIGTLRDRLIARLQSLDIRRECLRVQVDEQTAARGAGPDRELAHVDAAMARLRSAIARADSTLEATRRSLREHETELIALRAAADTSRMDRVLSVPLSDPSLWNDRIDRIGEYLRTTPSFDVERETRPILTGRP